MMLLLLASSALWSVKVAEALSTGAPQDACGTLSPDPGPFTHIVGPQTTPVPYEVDLSSLIDDSGGFSYVPEDSYACEFGGGPGGEGRGPCGRR